MEGFLFVAAVLMIGLFVTAPLRDPSAPRFPAESADLVALRAERDAKLRELRDAELDFATGKLTRQEHEQLDASLRLEAAELLHRLDEAAGEAA